MLNRMLTVRACFKKYETGKFAELKCGNFGCLGKMSPEKRIQNLSTFKKLENIMEIFKLFFSKMCAEFTLLELKIRYFLTPTDFLSICFV